MLALTDVVSTLCELVFCCTGLVSAAAFMYINYLCKCFNVGAIHVVENLVNPVPGDLLDETAALWP